LKRSHCVIAVSESNKKEIIDLIKQHEDIQVIYHGFDTDFFKPNKNIKKKNMVLTVATLDSMSIKRKGVDKFISLARKLPEISFVVVGKKKSDAQEIINAASSNVTFAGFVTQEELLNYYQQSKVYAQFSFHEGFGCTVAEAMLCNCVPVVTDKGSLPEVVGEYGFIIPFWEEEKAIESVKSALQVSLKKKEQMYQGIKNRFAMNKREEKIVNLISGL
jgi:glycosyltransferase involved in cell wall biosynthesis